MKNISLLLMILFTVQSIDLAQSDTRKSREQQQREAFLFWHGLQSKMTLHEFASYCAPVFWFSSDEPVLGRAIGKEIKIPEPFPFEEPSDSPVVYYQFRNILVKEGVTESSFIEDTVDFNNSIIDLENIGAVTLDYSHYYPFEAGLGGHDHDTEQVQFKIFIRRNEQSNGELHYEFILLEVNAKAHALGWYDNIYKIDTLNTEIQLPFHILFEEGKHASCTDINADGYYTPGYDVNVRVNDAWGLRDVIRTGDLFSAEFKGFMAKVRRNGYRVFPPLPEDSPHRDEFTIDGVYSSDNAIYELRPMPPADAALPDVALQKDMSAYSTDGWPIINEETSSDNFF